MSLEVEKNYSKNTIVGYANDLKCYEDFLRAHKRSLELNDLTPSTSRRFIQDQVLNHNAKPRTLQRRISCFKIIVFILFKRAVYGIRLYGGHSSSKIR
ncbi:site-specific integrase [Domibacillus tundrae]